MRKAASFALVLVIAACVASSAMAQDTKKQRAARLFDKGVAALENHDYKNALDAFKNAYELMPHWRVLAHIGTCYVKLNQPVKAINALERYLEEGSTDVTADERQAAEVILVEQRSKVGMLTLSSTIPDAEAKVDGESVGRAPFNPIRLLPGLHHVILFAGKDTHEADIEIAVGQETVLTLPLKPGALQGSSTPGVIGPNAPQTTKPTAPTADVSSDLDAAKAAQGATPQKRPRRSGSSLAFALSMVATGLGVATAIPGWIGYGYHTSSEKSFDKETNALEASDGYSYSATCPRDENGNFIVSNDREKYYCQTEWKRRWYESNADKSLIPAVVGTSVAVVGLTLSVVFFLNAQWFDDNDASASRLMLAPILSAETSGLSLVGTF
ncbi:MAG: tetratricopeptide repeat protein [Myxococcota bacterium]|jgi:hypothetical protein|nr:tetratricopeptide repeat protein [Myxococcota bacterium]